MLCFSTRVSGMHCLADFQVTAENMNGAVCNAQHGGWVVKAGGEKAPNSYSDIHRVLKSFHNRHFVLAIWKYP